MSYPLVALHSEHCGPSRLSASSIAPQAMSSQCCIQITPDTIDPISPSHNLAFCKYILDVSLRSAGKLNPLWNDSQSVGGCFFITYGIGVGMNFVRKPIWLFEVSLRSDWHPVGVSSGSSGDKLGIGSRIHGDQVGFYIVASLGSSLYRTCIMILRHQPCQIWANSC